MAPSSAPNSHTRSSLAGSRRLTEETNVSPLHSVFDDADLQQENERLKEEVDFLRRQLMQLQGQQQEDLLAAHAPLTSQSLSSIAATPSRRASGNRSSPPSYQAITQDQIHLTEQGSMRPSSDFTHEEHSPLISSIVPSASTPTTQHHQSLIHRHHRSPRPSMQDQQHLYVDRDHQVMDCEHGLSHRMPVAMETSAAPLPTMPLLHRSKQLNASNTVPAPSNHLNISSFDSCSTGSNTNYSSMDLDSSHFLHQVQDRAQWLVGLLVLQSMSSFIIARNEVMLQKHIVLVQFLTMLVGAGGNAGNQSSVRVIRGLATGQITNSNVKQYLWMELRMACILCMILGAAGCVRTLIFLVPLPETVAITTSLCMIVLSSIVLGAVLPLAMRALHIDPAHSSTTIQVIMDILGVTITVCT